MSGSFGIVNVAVGTASSTTKAKRAVSETSDGQVQATSAAMTVAMVSQIGDGQVQGGAHTQMMNAVTQIGDGQVQGNTVVTYMAVTEYSDGQPQATSAIKATATGISEYSDGQPQATTAKSTVTAVSQSSDGQPEASKATGVSQSSDGQPEASKATATAVSQTSDAQPQASGTATSSGIVAGTTSIAFCETNSSLVLSLNNGVLKDNKGRTGYIASNYQFQFDEPPQAGAIYTAGFSVCGNGTLSLGSSSIFYQCLSGSFYNLYDRSWAPQCSPVYIQTGTFVDCSS